MSRLPAFRFAALAVSWALPAAAVPAAAFAQAASPANPAPAQAPSTAAHPAARNGVSPQVEQHIRQLRGELGITPAEQPQWHQFAQVMRDNAARISQVFAQREAQFATMTALQDLQSYADVAQVHAANMQRLVTAFQTLYTALPEQQKQVADNVFRDNSAKQAARKS